MSDSTPTQIKVADIADWETFRIIFGYFKALKSVAKLDVSHHVFIISSETQL